MEKSRVTSERIRPILEAMERSIDSGTWRCWAALAEEQIVGQIWVHLIEKIPNPVVERESHAYISNLYVRESARGGTGNDLMDIALAWCRAQEVDAVILWRTERRCAIVHYC